MRKSTQPAPACPHRPPCPGCPRFGEPGIPPDAARRLATLCAAAGLAPPAVVAGAPFAWRVRARLAVRGRTGSPKIGIFQEGSHRIADVPRCLVHHPLVNRVAAALRHGMRAAGLAPYVERAHRGLVRYLQVVVERSSGRAQAVVVTTGADPASLTPLRPHLEREIGSALHSLWWNGNAARTNTILGPRWARLCGEPAVVERIGGARVYYPPGAFGQANLALADRLVAQVHGWVPDGARVAEFHAGCGAIGLGLAGRVRAIAFNEAGPAALEGLAMGLDAPPATARARAHVLPGAAAAHAGAVADADVVIADPPRKGLEPALLDALCTHRPARLALVSCSLPAFLREAHGLQAAGLALRAVTAYALFPHTAHVETVALFERH